MTTLLTCEDRIVVTNEENLPIIEVDETFSGTNLNTDFHWLMKVGHDYGCSFNGILMFLTFKSFQIFCCIHYIGVLIVIHQYESINHCAFLNLW